MTMTYFKTVDNGYIQSISTGLGQQEISQEQYEELMAHFNTRPVPPQGKGCRLKEDLSWELYDLPVSVEEEIPDRQAIELLLGGSQ